MVTLALLALPGISLAATIQAWLLISPDFKDSIMSTDTQEKDSLAKAGWKLNAAVLLQSSPDDGLVALHRLVRSGPVATDRYLEAGEAKVAAHKKDGFADEGIIGFVSAEEKPGLVPMLRFTNDGRNIWVVDEKHRAEAVKNGWKAAGVSFWLWPEAAKAQAPSKAGAKTPAKP
jgi:hypothetical protein